MFGSRRGTSEIQHDVKLPELTYSELINLLSYFGTDLQGEGSPTFKATNREGRTVGRHLKTHERMWPPAVSATLREMGITRDEFWAWVKEGKRRRPRS